MSETLQTLTDEYAAALRAYLADPQEAGRMRAYDLGRRTLTLESGVAELGVAHGKALAAALADAATAEERERLTGRAGEFLGEAMAPFKMVLRGYRDANAQLQRLNETLEERVKERTARLRDSEEELRDASRRKDEFLATLAHELRNPLAPIRNALHVVRLACPEGAAVSRAGDMIERQVLHLVRLIDDLLDVSRITRGKIELRMERLDLAAVVQSALEISRPHIEAAGHALTVALPPEPLYVAGDAVRLAQVAANLLNNAAKYTEPGGRIELTTEREGAHAVLRVRDTGVGIPAAILPHVFDLFVQAPSATERSQGGLGIGLTLVKRLLEMHGGGVEAHSDGPGKGSEFVARLPLAPEGGGHGRQDQEKAPPKKALTLRILIVDDNRDSADSLDMLLAMAGHEVRVADNGPAALEAARDFRPQVLLLDIQMPGMSGYEVARRLREQPETKGVVLAALTGFGSEEDRRRCFAAGFDHHFVKPVDLPALQEMLASVGSPPAR